MEFNHKKSRTMAIPDILNLKRYLADRNMWNLIRRYLNRYDLELIHKAHNSKHVLLCGYENLIDICIKHNYVGLLDWVYRYHGSELWTTVEFRWRYFISNAIRYGSVELLQWFQAHIPNWNTITDTGSFMYDIVFGYNKLDIADFLLANNYRFESRHANLAASYGNIEGLEWLYRHGLLRFPYSCYTSAAKDGHVNVLNFLYEHNCPITYDSRIIETGLDNCDLEIIQWGYNHGCPWTFDHIQVAIHRGYTHILEWAKECGID